MFDHLGLKAWLDELLVKSIQAHKTPGASLAVLQDGAITATAAGYLSLKTRVEADVDSVFQVGSITKVWTATLVMQLVDEGLLAIDKPLREYLPEFVLADSHAAETITTRQILSHTAGFEGDIFTDTGPGDDALAKYVASLSELPQLFKPGEYFSYNNTGFSVLGRLVEVLRNKPFDEVLLERIAAPLGLESVSPTAFHAILHRAAVGHLPGSDGSSTAAARWALPRSNSPAGAMLAMSAQDLLRFAALHLAAGKTPTGTQLLSPDSVAVMQIPQVEVPKVSSMGAAWGLGWELFAPETGPKTIGHDGGTIGQAAFLRVVPQTGLAIALLTNGGNPLGMYQDVVEPVLAEQANVVLPARPLPPEQPPEFDPRRFLGVYSDTIYTLELSQDNNGRLWLLTTPKDIQAEVVQEKPVCTELVGLDEGRLIAKEPKYGGHPVYAFLGDDERGRAEYIHYGRAVRRVAD